MNNKKCRFCGFINFIEAEVCRKCEAVLDAAAQTESGPQTPGYASQYGYQYPCPPPASYRSASSTIAKVLVGVGSVIVVALVITVTLAAWSYKKHSKVAWREFRPGEPGLVVMMPDEPTALDPIVTPTQMGEIKNYPYTATVSGQGVTMFCIVNFPFNFSNYEDRADKILEGELNSLMKRTNSTVISRRSLNEGETKGLAFDFKPAGNQSSAQKGFGKLIIGGNRLYLLSLVANEKSDLFDDKDKFLNATIPDY